ncbi:hypothetical protein BU23DRAFT_568947 [Bimuria novae-zelandiae CBS 107.79]|uniref:Uncharacterized protein n=1 Tax=Bimuria novae-zelandiae CBS 107.79 TaxID=1447943 RepID=A0A6A5V8Y7_9PLEO|nr:hypothetical protein BU23DRAFT_568947 [Bimuria novae-zelandiae CBS 107.79]
MKPNTIVPLALLVAIASAKTTCQEACYTEKPECKNGMFPLQSADGACWSCCISDEKFCLQVCFDEPPTCDDGMNPTKHGECYTCCRAPPLPTETEVEPFPLPTVVPRSFEVCDRQCDSEPPVCGDWVPFQPGGGPCWACCDPTSLPSTDPKIADEPEIEPKPLRPETCDRSCFDEPQDCGKGMISWSDDGVCWSCCDDPSLEQK